MSLLFIAQAASADVINIGVEPLNYLPYFDGSGANYSGYARELLDGFAASKGHTFKYTPRPVERLYQELIEGKIDMKFPDNALWKKELKEGKGFVFSTVIAKTTDGALMLNSEHAKAEIKHLGIIGGFEPWPYKDKMKSGEITVSANTDLAALIKMVSLKRIDAAYFNVVVAKKKIEELGLGKDISYNPKMPHDEGSFNLSTIKHGNIVKEFDEYMAKNSQIVTALKAKYGIE